MRYKGLTEMHETFKTLRLTRWNETELVCFCYYPLRRDISRLYRYPILGRRPEHQRCRMDIHHHPCGARPQHLRRIHLW